jgi:hypothetical protein
VRILVLVTRYPRPHTKGDQQRAFSWICDLAQRHDVCVVTSAARPAVGDALPTGVQVVCAPGGAIGRLASALWAGARGAPLQVGWMMPRAAWRAALREAPEADVVLAMTCRSLRGPLPTPLVIDHVDALSLNMARRAQGDEPMPVRAFARYESARLRAWERRCARWSAAAIVTTAQDAGALPPRPAVEIVPVGLDAVDAAWAAAGPDRPIDVVLSGNMRYPPNRRAARMLEREIAPALRARMPDVRIVVAGRGADTLGLRGALEVMSDVPDMLAVLRTAKIAIAPLELGTGSPYKVLEAAACGAAVVASPWAAACFDLAALTADDAAGYCDAICLLLSDPARRAALVAASQDAVRRHSTHALARRLETLLRAAAAHE